MAAAFQYTLVGRFTTKRPTIGDIEKIYMALGNFQGRVSIGARDYRSIYIRFELEADYRRAWSQPTWRMGESTLHTHRWTPQNEIGHQAHQSHVVPLWVGFPGLPAHLFTPKALESLANAVGTFICLDPGVKMFNRPGYARVCIEVDLMAPLQRRTMH
ncbi:unnamed protein product [Spirodela intermedia]|uniref:DUF4283 domain-containing protein n=1 Tax=Spirodela intermedia TaxID=51605 RepID=A0A7I8LKA0_SPIIN|nr:unnamed protein product [Spirodela intermedia]